MEGELLTVIIVVATALAFDFTNGFHDTANVVATSISTRAMAPRIAVGYAALLNFAGAFISLEVAATVASDVVDPGSISLLVVFAGLVGAIAWNLATWYLGLPSSSSHALIGGVAGAAFAAEGPDAVLGSGIIKMDPAQGFAAQASGAAVVFSASAVGFPLSTTHVMSGAVIGAGAAKRASAVRWGVAGNILTGGGLALA